MSKKTTSEEFISKVTLIHGDKYDYSKVTFVNIKTSVDIICQKHGLFKQRPQHHLAGHGCNKCARELITDSSRLTEKTFITKAKESHGDKYNYSMVNFDEINSNNDKVTIECLKHGSFNQIIRHHLSGSGCPICNESKGEEAISKYLTENNIKFIRQHRFSDCKDKKPLPFDFYLPAINTCIEYQGRQHYEPVKRFGGEKELIKTQKRDLIKLNYCIDNKITLERIRYDEHILEKLKAML